MKISVVIPCYNAERTIGRAIESALTQTYAADEIIVVDDGSTDESVSEVLKYRANVRLLQQTNSGPGTAQSGSCALRFGVACNARCGRLVGA